MTFAPIERCRSCGSSTLFPVIDLGSQPLANDYRPVDDERTIERFPLAVLGCGACSLVQLSGTIPPSTMFDTYHYFSSFSSTMVAAMAALAERIMAVRDLTADDLVIEVASNDGYLLQHYLAHGMQVLGIEPAANVAEAARAKGIPTLTDYFSSALAEGLRADGKRAAVLHANNVMAHVPDVNDVIRGIGIVLADDGIAVIETPYLVRMIENREFDTIYHEHVFYYSLTAFDALAQRNGLLVVDVEELAIHGGSLRLFLKKDGTPSPAVERMAAAEAVLGLTSQGYYEDFAARVSELRSATRAAVMAEAALGTVAAYGAAAKGTVLLNHFDIGRELVSFVVDRNPHKQGLVMPGVGIPIGPVERLRDEMPRCTLLLAWNFADEIIGQQREYLDAGGRFLIPVPDVRFV